MNLFELFVKIGVDDQASDKISTLSNKLGKGLKTAAKIGAAAVGAAATGITALTKSAVDNYAEYEQLVGGVQTLFGLQGQSLEEYAATVGKTTDEALDDWMKYTTGERKILNNAEIAYKTAGMSMNEYMETVTSFSASLIQSLNGDTAKAADYADQAIIDMSDNANKMGTDISMIQNAYQGFAKQNYTMLDNLKLGYGGTKEEMQRLLDDAEKLPGALGRDFDISNYADVVEAIHLVQENMGIAGTTAKEASETISGSLASMKSSWSNLVTGLADDEADFETLMDNFVESVKTAAGNIAPRIGIALNGVAELIKEIVPVAMQYIPQIITEFLPKIAESAVGIVSSISNAILENLDQILDMGIDIVEYLKNGIIENMPTIVESASEIVNTLSEKIIELSGVLAEAAYELVDALGNELSEQIPGLSVVFENLETVVISLTAAMVAYKTASAISGIIDTLRKATEGQTIAQMLLNAVMNANPFVLVATLVVGLTTAIISLWNANEGFRNAVISAWEAIKSAADTIFTAIANFFTETIPNAFQSMIDMIGERISAFIDIGRSVVEKIKSGISEAWNGLVSWFNGIWDSLFGNRSVNVKANVATNGSHAGGLAYVPFDGYIAELHKGERVLTASEAKAYKDGEKSSGGGVTVIQNIYSQAKTAADLMLEARHEQERAVLLGV